MMALTSITLLAITRLSTASLVHEYSVSAFNDLPDFEDNAHYGADTKSELKVLRKLFVNWNVNEDIGLYLLHKHFDLYDEEKVVEIIEENVSIAIPMTSQQIAAEVGEGIIPYRFRLTQNGTLIPLEFTSVNSAGGGEAGAVIIDRYNKLVQNQVFLKQLALTLDEFGLLNVFGIGFKSRDFVSPHSTQESSNNIDRVLITTEISDNFGNEIMPDSNTRAHVFWWFMNANDENTDVCSLHSQCDHCISPHHLRIVAPIPAPTIFIS